MYARRQIVSKKTGRKSTLYTKRKFTKKKTSGGFTRRVRRRTVRRGGYGRSKFRRGGVTVIINYRVSLPIPVTSGYYCPYGYFFNWNRYNLGYVPTISGDISTPPNWNFAEDNANRLTQYFKNYRRYRIESVGVTISDIFPNLKYNAVRSTDQVNAVPAQYGQWLLRSDTTTDLWRSADSYRDLVGVKGITSFSPGTSQRAYLKIKPRWQSISASGQTVTTTSIQQNESLAFQLDGTSRKTKPTVHAQFHANIYVDKDSKHFTAFESVKDATTYDYTTWNGLIAYYRPPMDYNGREYLQTGYEPFLANSFGGNAQMNFSVKFKFYGRSVATPLGYAKRNYTNEQDVSRMQFPHSTGQEPPYGWDAPSHF